MQIIVIYGIRFESGEWKAWDHICSLEEIEGVLDSARTKAKDHGRIGQPTYIDYLEGARDLFDVAFGSAPTPAAGDTWVCGVRVDNMLIGYHDPLLSILLAPDRFVGPFPKT